tara:strand:- start:531 stop:1091 length:561 start_codon:yes stop_codon:yes gene_type:complete
MPLPATRSIANIRRTIQSVIGNSVQVGADAIPVYHDYSFADPDNLRGTGNIDRAWVETHFIQQRAGSRGFTTLQIDCYSRIGEEGSATSDAFGMYVESIADEILSLFSGVDGQGNQRGYIQVQDFAADPLNPVNVNMFLLMQTPTGDIGVPQERVRLSLDQDFRRVTITMAFRTIQDAAGPAAFYT